MSKTLYYVYDDSSYPSKFKTLEEAMEYFEDCKTWMSDRELSIQKVTFEPIKSEYIPDKDEDFELPLEFKFKLSNNDETIFHAKAFISVALVGYDIDWEGNDEPMRYDRYDVEDFFKKGSWIILNED